MPKSACRADQTQELIGAGHPAQADLARPLRSILLRRVLDASAVDYDIVDSSNLQRQVIHGTSTVGKLKVESARERLQDLNPDIPG